MRGRSKNKEETQVTAQLLEDVMKVFDCIKGIMVDSEIPKIETPASMIGRFSLDIEIVSVSSCTWLLLIPQRVTY